MGAHESRPDGYSAVNSRKDTIMGSGGGIALIVVGLIFLLNVIQIDIPWINEYGLGVILTLAGIAVTLLNLTLWRTSSPWRRRAVVERRIEREIDDPRL
jgi:hypothetical protein